MPAWVPAGATNHFQRQIEAASINKSSSLQEVTFNVNDDYEQVTISESSEVKVVIPETGRVTDNSTFYGDEQNNVSQLFRTFLNFFFKKRVNDHT